MGFRERLNEADLPELDIDKEAPADPWANATGWQEPVIPDPEGVRILPAPPPDVLEFMQDEPRHPSTWPAVAVGAALGFGILTLVAAFGAA